MSGQVDHQVAGGKFNYLSDESDAGWGQNPPPPLRDVTPKKIINIHIVLIISLALKNSHSL